MSDKANGWGNSISSILEAYDFAEHLKDRQAAVAMKEEVVEYAYNQRGVPSRVILDMIFSYDKEQK